MPSDFTMLMLFTLRTDDDIRSQSGGQHDAVKSLAVYRINDVILYKSISKHNCQLKSSPHWH